MSPRKTHHHNLFFGIQENKIKDYLIIFIKWVNRVMNLNVLEIFILFLFLNERLLDILFSSCCLDYSFFFFFFFGSFLLLFECLFIYLFILLKLKIMFEGPRLFLWVVRDTTKFHNNSNIRIQKNFKLEIIINNNKKAHVWVGMLILECYEIVVRFYCVPSITLIFIC